MRSSSSGRRRVRTLTAYLSSTMPPRPAIRLSSAGVAYGRVEHHDIPKRTSKLKRITRPVPDVNREAYEQDTYLPAVQEVRRKLRQYIASLARRGGASGSSLRDMAVSRAMSMASQALGELRAGAGMRRRQARKACESRRAAAERTLLSMATALAEKEAAAGRQAVRRGGDRWVRLLFSVITKGLRGT